MCLQGASAVEQILLQFRGQPVRPFVIWEPVLATDWTSPATPTLQRISDPRAAQFWDKERLISHALGEHDRKSIIWDYIGVYPRGGVWSDRPPDPLFHGRPVVDVADDAVAALNKALLQ